MRSEDQEGDEIEECRPGDGRLRAQHARRYDGGDRIGRVMQAVEKVERQRDQNEPDQNRQGKSNCIHERRLRGRQTFSRTMP